MEEIEIDGGDFRLVKEPNQLSLVFNEIFPDDAGTYKVIFNPVKLSEINSANCLDFGKESFDRVGNNR